jgi:hypothetical protein
MKNILSLLISLSLSLSIQAQKTSSKSKSKSKKPKSTATTTTTKPTTKPTTNTPAITNTTSSKGGSSLSQDMVSSGLKELLILGGQNAAGFLSSDQGFTGNPRVAIPYPAEAAPLAAQLNTMGAGQLVSDFNNAMNRAASTAVTAAVPVLAEAVTKMTLADALSIYKTDGAGATNYLRTQSGKQLQLAFQPVVAHHLDSTGVSKIWGRMGDIYNKVPFVKPVNANLTDYVTKEMTERFFNRLAEEELKLRQNPGDQASKLLQGLLQLK